ncbi:MAG: hypothetical protein ACLP8S_03700 [Solirubrobacteraceae bacterium]
MLAADWQHGELALAIFLNGLELPDPGSRGQQIKDDSFLIMFNATGQDRSFILPRRRFGAVWALEISSAEPEREAGSVSYDMRTQVEVIAHSIVVLKRLS